MISTRQRNWLFAGVVLTVMISGAAFQAQAMALSQLSVVAATLGTMILAVAFHYEAIAYYRRTWGASDRSPNLVVLMLWMLAAHFVEIWIFGLVGYGLTEMGGAGTIAGVERADLQEHLYLSVTAFTTVGFGDVSPTGDLRFFTGTEALTGFLLITWSATFTYLEMQRAWGDDRDPL